MSKGKFLSSIFVVLSLIILPSCKWLKQAKDEASCPSCPGSSHAQATSSIPEVKPKDDSSVLITIGGKPALTAKEFEDFLNKSAEGNEQIRLLMQFMPDFKAKLLEAKRRSIVIGEWATREGVRNTKDYKEKEKMIMEQIRETLDTDAFINKHQPEVSDSDAETYYKENKDKDPRILMTPAGIAVVGIQTDEKNISEHVETLKKNKGKGIEKVAKSLNKTVTKFEPVNKETMMDSKLKSKILAISSFPEVVTAKDEKGKNWIIFAKSKEKAQYRPVEQVKDLIKKMLKPKKLEDMLEKELPKLEKEYNVVQNTKYLEDQKKQQEKEAQEAASAMAKMLKQSAEKPSDNKTQKTSNVATAPSAA